jgi:putative transposase
MGSPYPVRRRIRLGRASYGAGQCFFLTISTHLRAPIFRSYPELADEVTDIIVHTASERKTLLFAWCLMPDHLHLLAKDADIVELVRLVKGRATPLLRRRESKRRLWQRSFYDHGLRADESIRRVTQYIFENPVRRQMVDCPSDYRWSGSNVWPHWRSFYQTLSGRG